MSTNPLNMAIVPYTPPMTAWEFIKSEVEKGLSSGTIQSEQLNSQPSIPPSLTFDLFHFNLSSISEILGTLPVIHDNSLSGRGIERRSSSHVDIDFNGLILRVLSTFSPTNNSMRRSGLSSAFEDLIFEDF